MLHGDVLFIKFIKQCLECCFSDVITKFNGMVSIHQYFWFHHRYYPCFLTKCSITCKCMDIGFDTARAWDAFAYGDHCSPFGKFGAKLFIFGQPVAQTIQSFGDFLARMTCQILGPRIDFDAGHDALFDKGLWKWDSISGRLPDGFIKQNYSTDIFTCAWIGDQKIAIGPA